MNRNEHLAWCKKHAIAYVDAGDLSRAFMLMISGIRKYPDTYNETVAQIGMTIMMGGHLTKDEMRKFIEGFN